MSLIGNLLLTASSCLVWLAFDPPQQPDSTTTQEAQSTLSPDIALLGRDGDVPLAEPTCGLYALYAAGTALDHRIPLAELFDGKFLQSDQSGSSADDLCRAAKHFGIDARTVHGASLLALTDAGRPVLLLLSVSSNRQGVGHWVTLLGRENGGYLVFDSGDGSRLWKEGELLSQWEGLAIVLGPSGSVWRVRIMSWLLALCWLGPPLALILVCSCFWHWPVPPASFAADSRSTPGMTLMLLVFTACWGAVLVLLNPHHPLRQGQLARMLECKSTLPATENVDGFGLEHAVLIDCRLPAAFRHGHLAGAVNIPVMTGVFLLQNRLDSFDPGSTFVVYCQSDKCSWAAKLAGRMQCPGFRALVLKGGYEANSSKDSQRSPPDPEAAGVRGESRGEG